jgi:cytoskeletal protein RodZ
MTQPNLLELAKQGDPQAIATLMNRSLQPKGMTASVDVRGDRLQVLLESAQVANRQALTAFVRNGITSLGLKSMHSIEIISRQTGRSDAAWTEQIFLQPDRPTEPDLEAASVPASSIQPPRRPVAPPPPPPRRFTPPADAPQSATPLQPVPIDPVTPTSVPTDQIALAEQAGNGAIPAEAVTPIAPVTPTASVAATEPVDLNEAALAPDPVIYSGYADGDRRDDLEDPVIDPLVEDDLTPDESLEYVAYEEQPDLPVEDEPGEGRQLVWTDADGVEHAVEAPPEERPTRLGRSPWFYLILLIVAGWIAAIVGFSIWYSRQEGIQDPASEVSPPDPVTAVESPETLSDNPLGDAESRAEQASTLAQAAQSADDWNLVVTQWEQAIALLQGIPADSPDYATAQQRLSTYQQSLTAAQQQAANVPASADVPPTSTVTVGNQVNCRDVESTPESAPVELTNVQFDPEASETGSNFVVGCLTNHSEQTVREVAVSYRAGSAENPNSLQDGYSSLGIAALEPGETVPFRSSLPIGSDVTTVNVEAVFWTPEGASQPQQIETPLTLERSARTGSSPASPSPAPSPASSSPTPSPANSSPSPASPN